MGRAALVVRERGAFDRLDGMRLDGVGVDTWGCDFALIGERGNLLENPYHYRDTRHDGAMDIVCRRNGRDRLYAQTGSQIIPINTLFQLHAACERTPHQIRAATAMLMVPDLFNYWLTGKLQSEYTIASTSQMVDPRTRQWARALLMGLGLPEHLLQPMVEPGSVLGVLRGEANKSHAGAGRDRTGLPRHCVSFCRRVVATRRLHQLRHLVAVWRGSGRAGHHLRGPRFEFYQRRRRLREDASAQKH